MHSLLSYTLCQCMAGTYLNPSLLFEGKAKSRKPNTGKPVLIPHPHYLKVSAKRYVWTGLHFCQHTKWVNMLHMLAD